MTVPKMVPWIGIPLIIVIALFIIPFGSNPVPPPLATIHAENFQFENYGPDSHALAAALRKLFPVGASKAYVDSILVEKTGAKIRDYGAGEMAYIHKAYTAHYTIDCQGNMTWYVRIRYDANLKLKDLNLKGPC